MRKKRLSILSVILLLLFLLSSVVVFAEECLQYQVDFTVETRQKVGDADWKAWKTVATETRTFPAAYGQLRIAALDSAGKLAKTSSQLGTVLHHQSFTSTQTHCYRNYCTYSYRTFWAGYSTDIIPDSAVFVLSDGNSVTHTGDARAHYSPQGYKRQRITATATCIASLPTTVALDNRPENCNTFQYVIESNLGAGGACLLDSAGTKVITTVPAGKDYYGVIRSGGRNHGKSICYYMPPRSGEIYAGWARNSWKSGLFDRDYGYHVAGFIATEPGDASKEVRDSELIPLEGKIELEARYSYRHNVANITSTCVEYDGVELTCGNGELDPGEECEYDEDARPIIDTSKYSCSDINDGGSVGCHDCKIDYSTCSGNTNSFLPNANLPDFIEGATELDENTLEISTSDAQLVCGEHFEKMSFCSGDVRFTGADVNGNRWELEQECGGVKGTKPMQYFKNEKINIPFMRSGETRYFDFTGNALMRYSYSHWRDSLPESWCSWVCPLRISCEDGEFKVYKDEKCSEGVGSTSYATFENQTDIQDRSTTGNAWESAGIAERTREDNDWGSFSCPDDHTTYTCSYTDEGNYTFFTRDVDRPNDEYSFILTPAQEAAGETFADALALGAGGEYFDFRLRHAFNCRTGGCKPETRLELKKAMFTQFSTFQSESGVPHGYEGVYTLGVSQQSLAGETSYCKIAPNFKVDYDADHYACTHPYSGDGEYDESLPYGERCCSAVHVNHEDKTFEYTNEDCAKILTGTRPHQHLCSFDHNFSDSANNPSSTGFDAAWLDASLNVGEAVYLGCDEEIDGRSRPKNGHEFLSLGEAGTERDLGAQWVSCTNTGFKGASGDDLGLVLPIVGTDDNGENPVAHEYLCIDRLAPHLHTIVECNAGDSYDLNRERGGSVWVSDSLSLEPEFRNRPGREPEGGMVAAAGNAVFVEGGDVYYCAEDSKWVTDLDDLSLAGPRGIYCDTAQHPKALYPEDEGYVENFEVLPNISWTGSLCCGDYDDRSDFDPENPDAFIFSENNEYYNDDSTVLDPRQFSTYYGTRSGACFNSEFQENGTMLTLTRLDSGSEKTVSEVIIHHGTFHGCALDHEWALQQWDNKISCPGYGEGIRLDVEKPYEGSFGSANPADYGFTGDAYSNDFLLSFKDNANQPRSDTSGQPLIKDNTYCEVKEMNGFNYFCSYNETWSFSPPEEYRTHLSFIPWDDSGVQQGECCAENSCWNGTACVQSILDQPHDVYVMNSQGDGFVCVEGSWKWAYNKTTWDGSQNGFCPENSQCLVHNNGGEMVFGERPFGDQSSTYNDQRFKGPSTFEIDALYEYEDGTTLCLNDREYYGDHYCENGEWTSRTKFVALSLLEAAGDETDFTLYCDSYDKVLNQVNYTLSGVDSFEQVDDLYFKVNPQSYCLNWAGEEIPCANHVCTLTTYETDGSIKDVYFGTSLNTPHHRESSTTSLLYPITDFGKLFGDDVTFMPCLADQKRKDGSFGDCNGELTGTGVYFQGEKSLVVYLGEESSFSFLSDFPSLFSNLFSDILGFFINQVTDQANEQLLNYNTFNELAQPLLHSSPSSTFSCDTGNCLGTTLNDEFTCSQPALSAPIHDYNTLYYSVKNKGQVNERSIFALAELEKNKLLLSDNPTLLFGAVYRGFGALNLCESVYASGSGYQCDDTTDDGSVVVLFTPTVSFTPFYPASITALDPSFISLFSPQVIGVTTNNQWDYLTVANRIHNAED